MAQTADQILSGAKAASNHADATEALSVVHPIPVPSGLKTPAYRTADSSDSPPTAKSEAPKSDYSLARELRERKDNVDEVVKASGQ